MGFEETGLTCGTDSSWPAKLMTVICHCHLLGFCSPALFAAEGPGGMNLLTTRRVRPNRPHLHITWRICGFLFPCRLLRVISFDHKRYHKLWIILYVDMCLVSDITSIVVVLSDFFSFFKKLLVLSFHCTNYCGSIITFTQVWLVDYFKDASLFHTPK